MGARGGGDGRGVVFIRDKFQFYNVKRVLCMGGGSN